MTLQNKAFLIVLLIGYSCTSLDTPQEAEREIIILKDSLKNKTLGIFEVGGDFKFFTFHRAVVGFEPPYLTIPSVDTMLNEIVINDTLILAKILCKIEPYHKFFSYTFNDCSSLHLDIETGVFRYYRHDTSVVTWRFTEYAPQVLPNQGMEVHQNRVYVLNSSYNHNVTIASGALSYYKNIQPIISFQLNDPNATVRALGRFPSFYSDADKSVGDYQPYFCVNRDLQCVLSFRYSDSLYFADVETDEVQAVACKSSFYNEPDFLTFEESKSMTASRKFDAESAMYLWVRYNPIRDEYYRYFQHAMDENGKTACSILVLDANLNQTAEFIFDPKVYGLDPTVSTKDGFMILNQKVSRAKKRYCFEHFGT